MSKMLSSWKEIALFFGKGVRTVQRWEKTLDLPIHRPPGAPSNVVLARTSDLEEWMHRGPSVRKNSSVPPVESRVLNQIADLEKEVRILEQHFGIPPRAFSVENPEDLSARLKMVTESLHQLVEQVHHRPMAA